MKRISALLAAMLIALFAVFAMGSGESSTVDQGDGSASKETTPGNIGKYSVVIDSCRVAEDYEGKPVAIVKYIYTNVADENATAFYIAFEDHVYQSGIGLNKAYFLADTANYNSENQTKQIKKGATIEVEVAYSLNDTTTEIEVEVEELFSFNETKVTKKFSING